jgi:hypothetical protein
MHKMTTISVKIVKVVILSENTGHFISCSACNKRLLFSQLEISHVLNGPGAKNQHRWRGQVINVSFSKGLTKLAIILDYKRPGMLCLALPARPKVLKLDFQSKFSMSKFIRIFLIFFSLRNKILGAHFLLKWFFGNFYFKTTSNHARFLTRLQS